MYAASLLLLAGLLAPTAFAKHGKNAGDATVYLIRHGEKPASGNGLDPQGVQRAQCLKTVFGPESPYKIDYIMAETPQSDGSQQRPYDTVLPLSKELGLTIDTSCARDDAQCVEKVVSNYKGSGNILICWEHGQLTDIVTALGDSNAPTYPDSNFNYIWTDPSPYSKIVSITSENCPGLDNNSSRITRKMRPRY